MLQISEDKLIGSVYAFSYILNGLRTNIADIGKLFELFNFRKMKLKAIGRQTLFKETIISLVERNTAHFYKNTALI